MKYLASNIRFLRKSNRLDQDKLAEILERSQPTIQQWEAGNRQPDVGMANKIADLFKVELDALLNSDLSNENIRDSLVTNISSIPIYNPICCGTGLFVDDEIIGYMPLPTEKLNPKKQYFGQYANGDSMINEKIFDGDIIIFEVCSIVDNGDIGCFCVDENVAVCKKYMRDESSNIYLISANENYPPISVDVSLESFRVIGKLAFVVSDRR